MWWTLFGPHGVVLGALSLTAATEAWQPCVALLGLMYTSPVAKVALGVSDEMHRLISTVFRTRRLRLSGLDLNATMLLCYLGLGRTCVLTLLTAASRVLLFWATIGPVGLQLHLVVSVVRGVLVASLLGPRQSSILLVFVDGSG